MNTEHFYYKQDLLAIGDCRWQYIGFRRAHKGKSGDMIRDQVRILFSLYPWFHSVIFRNEKTHASFIQRFRLKFSLHTLERLAS